MDETPNIDTTISLMDMVESSRPPMRVMPNGSKLYCGGVPGNKGGGAPKNRVRTLCADGALRAVPIISKILEDVDATRSEKLKAFEIMCKFGIGELKSIVLEKSNLIEAIADTLSEFQHANNGNRVSQQMFMELYECICERLKAS